MAQFFEMPQASPTMTSGVLLSWKKKEGDALAGDAQADGVAQGGWNLLQPFAEVFAKVFRDAVERPRQRARAAEEAAHFERTGDIDRRDDTGDAEGQRAAADVADGDPDDGGQAEDEGDEAEVAVHAVWFRSMQSRRRSARRPASGAGRVRRAACAWRRCRSSPASCPAASRSSGRRHQYGARRGVAGRTW